jgi:hypothetical protein
VSTGELQARREGMHAKIRLQTVGDTVYQNWLCFDRSGGTFGSLGALSNNTVFGSVVGVGNYGNSDAFAHGPEIRMYTTEAWATGHYGSAISFLIVTNGGTVQKPVMVVDSAGVHVTNSTLDVNGNIVLTNIVVNGISGTVAGGVASVAVTGAYTNWYSNPSNYIVTVGLDVSTLLFVSVSNNVALTNNMRLRL